MGLDKQLKVFHYNIQSLRNKKLNVEVMLDNELKHIDILCITEHWLEEHEIDYYNFQNSH